MNTFKVGDIVKTIPSATVAARIDGKISYIACQGATVHGGRICSRKSCTHNIKDYVWVLWPGIPSTYSYHYSELAFSAIQPASTTKNTIPIPAGSNANEVQEVSMDNDNVYVEMAKEAIKDSLKRGLRSFSGASEPIPDSQIDWDAYNGFKRGSVRKGLTEA